MTHFWIMTQQLRNSGIDDLGKFILYHLPLMCALHCTLKVNQLALSRLGIVTSALLERIIFKLF